MNTTTNISTNSTTVDRRPRPGSLVERVRPAGRRGPSSGGGVGALILALVATLSFATASCSTVRLTPSAARYLKANKGVKDARDDYEKANRDLGEAKWQGERILQLVRDNDALRAAVGQHLGITLSNAASKEDQMSTLIAAVPAQSTTDNTSTPDNKRDLAQRIVDCWWLGQLPAANDVDFAAVFHVARPAHDADLANSPQVSSAGKVQILSEQLHDRELDVKQLQRIERGEWEYFVDGSVYFSIEPIVAIEPRLQAVAIPSLGINWRPFNLGQDDYFTGQNLGSLSALAFQLTFGGALNPSGGSDSSSGGAIGLGLSIPVANIGAFSFGAIWYSDNGDPHNAPYISLTLGDFGKSAAKGQP